MKKVLAALLIFLTLFTAQVLFADPPGPPDPGPDPISSGGVPVGGPIGGGIMILLALAVVYGAYRIYKIKVSGEKKEASS